MFTVSRKNNHRSNVGSSVSVLNSDGYWRQGTVLSIRDDEERLIPIEKKYEVEVEGDAGWERFYRGEDIYGSGFSLNLSKQNKLLEGQTVFVTHSGREVRATVQSHDRIEDCVALEIEGVGTIFKSIEEIRLLESRKSARLSNTDMDFSRIANVNVHSASSRKMKNGHNRRRLHSMSSFPDKNPEPKCRQREKSDGWRTKTTSSIDVPSRKRRTSESRLQDVESGYNSGGSSSGGGGISSSFSSSILRSKDELATLINSSLLKAGKRSSLMCSEEELRDCTAAMVLMNLSVSPSERWSDVHSLVQSPRSPGTPQPSPVLSISDLLAEEDEEPLAKYQRSSAAMYKCTWRGCTFFTRDQSHVERHVRAHLGRPEPRDGEERDFEEEFYYTDIDVEDQDTMDIMDADIIIDNQPVQMNPASDTSHLLGSSAPSSLSLLQPPTPSSNRAISEHLDMAKSPSLIQPTSFPSPTSVFLVSNGGQLVEAEPVPGQPSAKKLVSIFPKPETAKSFLFQPSPNTSIKSDRKCRKVYGLEQKDQWCTQCRWKKACARFS